ncbi:hypothetical protein [Glycomyces dulcitolivorans]|uniref:hypothetical protein n=1 Tax=Glycomyces dulcitolivorans TaxID=2200759 RepID=UPI0018E54E55|nr:hypothetical protein [Glycomyces dulcitolivorans]
MSKRSSPDAAFWCVASAFTVTMLGTTLPTPLYVLFQREMHFSTLTGTVFVVAYIAISIPVVGAGLVAQTAGLRAAGIVFSFAVAALAAVAASASRRKPAILAT